MRTGEVATARARASAHKSVAKVAEAGFPASDALATRGLAASFRLQCATAQVYLLRPLTRLRGWMRKNRPELTNRNLLENIMSDLSPRDLELVALGAAMGSNCPPCMEYHIPQSRKVGLSDAEIHAAILHADKIRQVPARKTLQTALAMLPSVAPEAGRAESVPGCGCAQDRHAPSACR